MADLAQQGRTGDSYLPAESSLPLRPLNVASWTVSVRKNSSGVTYLRPSLELGRYPRTLTECLDTRAKDAAERTFLAERDEAGEWRRIPYADLRTLARGIAQALLNLRLPAGRPIAILSGNGIEHALVALGAMYAGIPYAPISPAYSLVSSDFGRLRHIMDLLSPGLVFASDGEVYGRAIRELVPPETFLLVGSNPPAGRRAEMFSYFAAVSATDAVDRAHAAVGPDTVAKILFTSGSTGIPRGVITTHRMLTSNQEMLRAVFPFFAEQPPIICDWLPWHHTFGGSHNFGLVLYNAGTLYIDHGKPTPGDFAESLRNLREIAPTVYFNVPKGYELLLPHLAKDRAFREHFFSRLGMAFFAAAGLQQITWDEFDRLAVEAVGARIPMLTGLGATETAPFAMCARKENRRSGVVGLPVPGVELKLAPVNDKLEARVRGPNVTPGFWGSDDLTRAAFDEEGYYRMGDALMFIDPADPNRGFLFDGRLAEDFKLSSGTWVSVGPLRAKLILHGAPLVKDAVLAGRDRDEVTALIVPDPDEYARVEAEGRTRAAFEALLRDFLRRSTGSSSRIVRAIVLRDPPSLDAGEVTDKGTLNQAAVLKRRAHLVEQLYSNPYAPEVIVVGE
jgi:feruloyl-CoA synthase